MFTVIVWQGAGFYQRTVQNGAIFLRFVYDEGRIRQLDVPSTQYFSAIPWLVYEVRTLV